MVSFADVDDFRMMRTFNHGLSNSINTESVLSAWVRRIPSYPSVLRLYGSRLQLMTSKLYLEVNRITNPTFTRLECDGIGKRYPNTRQGFNIDAIQAHPMGSVQRLNTILGVNHLAQQSRGPIRWITSRMGLICMKRLPNFAK